ncbi:MAG: L,D-transpeptidase [Deltaproteobacteria bacterium]|nr:L,D-transpeptidase [Deltaproteobacteria bacterium]
MHATGVSTSLLLAAALLCLTCAKKDPASLGADGGARSSLLARYETGPAPAETEPPAEESAKVDGIVPGIEPETEPPLYGRAVWNVVTVYDKPDMRSLHLGYLRKGAVVVLEDAKVADKTPKKPSCRKGWWMLADGGGYICSSKGVEAHKDLQPSDLYPMPPATDAPMPYSYGHIMVDLTPLYERPPTSEEEAQVDAWVAQTKKELKNKALEKEQAKLEADKKKKEKAKEAAPTPEPASEAEAIPASEPAPPAPAESAAAEEEAAATPAALSPVEGQPTPVAQDPEPEEEEADEGIPFDFVRMLMLKGFYISIDRQTIHHGEKWYRTIKGQYVKAEKVFPVNIRIRGGKELEQGFSFPAGIVLRETIFERVWNKKKNHIMKNRDVVYDKFFVFKIHGKQIDKVNDIDAVFYEIDEPGETMVLSWSIVPVMKKEPPPPEVPEHGKWIHVDVSDQTLTAYEGEQPVFLTLISSGNEKQDEEYMTPRGTFWMQSKHVSATMDNLALDDGSYSIEDVPWTMYFHSSYALHGAFWHSVFGHQRSHGCVNMTPRDAKWIFDWSEPRLPLGWHGVVATKDRPGTVVKVTD